MSQENVERVQAIFASWENGEYSNTDWADPEIEFIMETPGGGTSRGLQAMGDTWRDFLRAWEEFHVQVREVIDAGDQVLVLHDFGGRGHESGVPISGMRGAALFTLKAGRVQRLALYTEWDAALEAAGLRE